MARRFKQQKASGEFTTTIELKNETEVDVIVEYNYSPSTPDVFYLSNGDPGYPGDPEEAEILSIRLDEKNGRVISEEEISEKTFESLVEKACEAARDANEAAYEDAMDSRADMEREREMFGDE